DRVVGRHAAARWRGSLPPPPRAGDPHPRGARADRARPGRLPRRDPARVRACARCVAGMAPGGRLMSEEQAIQPGTWELSCLVDYFLDAHQYEFTLTRDDEGLWTLELHGFEMTDEAGESEWVRGTSIEWSTAAEFWEAAYGLQGSEYQINESYL